ncbi:MAG: glutamine-hydrolyzing GMP synthase [Actinomycetota bacterium]|nr:glutamine-hydrolyzing GMP synthase [Actinomycetota bacterium]
MPEPASRLAAPPDGDVRPDRPPQVPGSATAAREITEGEPAAPETVDVRPPASAREEVLVLDFGGQYSQLIARRIRECGVFAELLPADVSLERISERSPRALVLSGGPASVYADDAPRLRSELLDLGMPVLGICYGMQAMALELGGRVEGAESGEFGRTALTLTGDGGSLLRGLPQEQQCWMSHRDCVMEAPQGFAALAASPGSPVAALEAPERGLYGIQFHPEVVHTPYGTEVLERFLREIVGCEERWSPASVIDEQVEKIRAQVGDAEVICGLSGGVDSATAAALVHRAIGDQLTCVLVDHGLLRKGEAEQVVKAFREEMGIRLVHVDAEERFLARLAGETEPEAKRKIIGSEFIRVFEDEARNLADAKYLVQGTLYSDVIESGGEGHGAATIKSHHNVGGLPDDLDFELVEPLRMLFKDEVRAVASELGLADKLVWRQPFPGPGLGIRIVGGEVNKERLDILRDADAILQEEIRAAGLYRELWQSFCVLPVVRSVGVQGDGRTYAYPIVIRAVTSEDAMTADWARLPYELLERVSNRIINEVPGVNRVALDISSKPPATIEWE